MKNEEQKHQTVILVPFGSVRICMTADSLVSIDLLAARSKPVSIVAGPMVGVVEMILRYLEDPGASLTTKLKIDGTDFQQRVWRRLLQIPVGDTATYGQLAAELNSSARAVGNACRSNPCPLVIPCHRVVAKSGLGGFSGQLSGPKLEIKRWLLAHEGYL